MIISDSKVNAVRFPTMMVVMVKEYELCDDNDVKYQCIIGDGIKSVKPLFNMKFSKVNCFYYSDKANPKSSKFHIIKLGAK